MIIPPAESIDLINRAASVRDQAVKLCGRLLGGMTAEIDYVTVFTTTVGEHHQGILEAELCGHRVAEKNGGVYRLDDDIGQALGGTLLRVRKEQNIPLIGCADFLVEDYAATKDALKKADYISFTETPKKASNGTAYTIMEVTDAQLKVAAYFPSVRISKEVMGIE